MKGKRINLKDAITTIEARDAQGAPIPFSAVVVTYDKQKNTGGKFLEISDVVFCRNEDNKDVSAGFEAKSKPSDSFRKSSLSRYVKFLTSGEIRKINLRLLVNLNNMTVVW